MQSLMNDLNKTVFPSKREVVYFAILSIVLAAIFTSYFMLADSISSYIVNKLIG